MNRRGAVVVALVTAAWCATGIALVTPAHPRDNGQWDETDAAIRMWFRSLMQPDHPETSCCGEADAYWADSYEVSPDGEYVAIVTDERDDGPLHRAHMDIGTRIVIPQYKIKFDQGNPTGHGIVFLRSDDQWPYCYLPPGGV